MSAIARIAREQRLVKPAPPLRDGDLTNGSESAPEKRNRSIWNWLPIVGAVVLGCVYVISLQAPSVGLFHDDGIYAVTAKALAEGRGYRIVSLPQEIPQTKYPFLFPAALALLWRVWPDFPDNATALKILPFTCAVAWFILTYKLLVLAGAGRIQAKWIVLLTAASPLVVFLSTSLMSETMFGAFFYGALLAAKTTEKSNSDRMAWIAGACGALAFLTRTIGISLLAAIPLALIFQRRFGAVRRFLAAAVPLACVWPVWVSLQHVSTTASLSYYSSAVYNSWNILTSYTLHEKIHILILNIIYSLMSPTRLIDLPQSAWILLLMAIMLVGAFATRTIRLNSMYLALATYLLICVCWVWPPGRFIAVILPLSIFVVCETAARLGARRITAALTAITFCIVLTRDLRGIPRTVAEGQFIFGSQPTDNWTELRRVFLWISRNTPPNSTVLANLDPAVYLYTGRKSVRDFVADSGKLFYGTGSPGDDPLGSSVDDLIRGASADFLVVTPDRDFAEADVLRRDVERFAAAHPGALELIARPGSDPEYRIYRIHRTGNPE